MAARSVILVLVCVFCGALAKDRVPVLIWNADQAQKNIKPAVPALQVTNYAAFQSKFLADFEPKNILLFIQDALSVEDLSSHPAEFRQVKEWMEQSHSLYLPNVEDPAHLAHDLPSHGYNMVLLEPGVPAAGLSLKEQDNNLVVVKLPSTLTNPSRRRALQKAVEVMENVISKIGQQREFTVIFTGQKPSVEDRSEKYESLVRLPRAAIRYEKGYFNDSCVMLYIRNNFTITNNKTVYNLTDIDVDNVNGHCDDLNKTDVKTAKIILTYNDKLGFIKMKLTFNFKGSKGSWDFTDVDAYFDEDDTQSTYNMKLKSPEISEIPIGMSYSCSQTIYLASNSTAEKLNMEIGGVQMEAFSSKYKFGPAWDCIGFFTVPIWVSLLTTLLLVIILTTGLYMLSDIKTMDRFDDPKGQPIMLPVTE